MGSVCSSGQEKQNPSRSSEKLKSEKGNKHQKRINLEPLQMPFPREWLPMPAKTAKTGASKVIQRSSFLGREGIGSLAMTGQ